MNPSLSPLSSTPLGSIEPFVSEDETAGGLTFGPTSSAATSGLVFTAEVSIELLASESCVHTE